MWEGIGALDEHGADHAPEYQGSENTKTDVNNHSREPMYFAMMLVSSTLSVAGRLIYMYSN